MDNNRHCLFSKLANEVALQLPTHIRIRKRGTKQNAEIIKQAVKLWVYLLGDFDKIKPYASLRRRYENWVIFVKRHDFSDVFRIYDTVFELIVHERYNNYDGFKRHLTWEYGEDVGLALSPFNLFIVKWFETGHVDHARAVLTMCRFFKKLPLSMPDLKVVALTSYLSDEESLKNRELDLDTVRQLNLIMIKWLKNLDFSNLVPGHGRGVVAECGRDKEMKYSLLGVDAKLVSCVRSINNFDNARVLDYFPAPVLVTKNGIKRTSRVIFVPKTYKALRTISAEPVTLQYFQQGVKDILYKYINNHSYLSKRFPLSDQGQNKDLARLGAFTGEVSTIDLSSASDLVGYDLVRAVFRGTPLYKWLLGTRSSHTELPNKDVLPMLKFAPMGSALCFPVETLVFGAVCELCRKRNPHRWYRYDTYSVFGDDIIVPKLATDEVMETLESLGFRVNKEKSFTHGNFRESCGGEYFYGLDVTPVYARISPLTHAGSRAKCYNQLCDLANYSQERGLCYLRLGAIHMLRESFKSDFQPLFSFTTEKSPRIYSPTPSNTHLKTRGNVAYQAMEFLCGSVVTRSSTIPNAGRYEYFDRQLTMARRGINLPSMRHLEKYAGNNMGVHDLLLRKSWRRPY